MNRTIFKTKWGWVGVAASSRGVRTIVLPKQTRRAVERELSSVSSNGTGNGIVWVGENGGTAVLHAYDATNLGTELYNSNQASNNRDHFGSGNKFITPTIANGKVYVGTQNSVGVFGLF